MTAETGASVDLAAFLLARIAEDEDSAEAAWREADHSKTSPVGEWHAAEADHVGVLIGAGPDEGPRDEYDYRSGITALITRFGPARVLAECAARRNVIEFATEGMCAADCGPGCCWTVLKLMAQPHSAHPDFNADWAVA